MGQDKVLFEIKEENLETGMRGYPVGYCTTSTVDAEKGLHYRGQKVSELAHREPIDVIYLLMHGKEGSQQEIASFSKDLIRRAPLNPKTVEAIKNLPRQGHPMALFCASLFVAGMLEGKEDYQQDCLNLIAKIPQIVAEVINHHAGWGGTQPSKPELGYMENFAQMLNVPNGNLENLTKIFKLFNVLHYDHGGGNLSTFVGKATASGLQDMWGSIASAMSALAGPRHGRANQDCLNFVKETLQDLSENATVDQVEALIRQKLTEKQLIFGFGHAVLRVEDPRATVLYELAKKRFSENPLVKMALLLREGGPKVLKDNPKISDPYPNVDAISGTVLSAAGFAYPEYFTVLFGLSRSVGIAIQIVYERLYAREGKGTPIIRPKYFYKENI
jgi:citrate synthase